MAGPQENKNHSPRLFHRIGKEILLFAALVGVTVLLLRPLQETVRRRMEELRDLLIQQGEEFIGREIEYGSIGPSIFGALDIRNIRIRRADSSPVLTISRLRVSYSLFQLIRGEAVESLRSVRVDRPLLSFDAARDQDLLDLFALSSDRSPADLIRAIAAALPEDVRFSIRNGEGEFIQNDFRLRADGIGFDASVRSGRIGFQGKWNAAVSLGGLLAGIAEARMSGRLSGDFSADLSGGGASLELPYFRGDRFRLRPLTVKLSLAQDVLEIRKINDRLPYDISLDYNLSTQELTGGFHCENFLFRDLLSLRGAWEPYDHWLATRVSGSLSMEKGAEEILYRVDITGTRETGTGPGGVALGGVSFVVRGRGTRRQINFDELALSFPGGDFSFRGRLGFSPFAPNGFVTVSNLGVSGDGRFDGGFNIVTRGREISLFGENVAAGSITLQTLDLSLIPEDRGISFEMAALRSNDFEEAETAQVSRFSLAGSFDYEPRNLQASLLLEAVAFRDLMELARPFAALPPVPALVLPAIDPLRISTEVFITTDFKHVSYNAPRFIVVYGGGGEEILVLASLSGTDRRFEILESQVSWGGARAELAGLVDFSKIEEISFSLRSSFRDYFYEVEGLVLGGRSLNIRGSYGLQIYLDAAGPGTYSGYVSAQEIPLPYGGGVARLSVSSSLAYEVGRHWAVDINRFEMADLATPGSPFSILRFSGEANPNNITLEDIVFDDGRGILRGALAFGRTGAGFEGRGSLVSPERQERYDLEASYSAGNPGEGRFSARLAGTNAQIVRMIRNPYNLLATGEILLNWEEALPAYRAELRLDSLTGRFQEREFSLSAGADLDDKVFSVRDLRVRYAGLEASLPRLRLDRGESRAGAEGSVRGNLGGRDLDMNFSVEAEFGAIDSWLRPAGLADSLSGNILVENFRYDTIRADTPSTFHFSRTASLISFFGGPQDMIRFTMRPGGEFYAGISKPSPVRGTIIGAMSPQTIEAQTQDLYIDVGVLGRFLPMQEVIFPGGIITASLRISGPLGDPEFFGVARGGSLRIGVPDYLPEDIRPIPVVMVFEGNEASFGPVPAAVGLGSGEVSGRFYFDRWIPSTYTIDIQVPPATPIPYGFDKVGITVRGNASGRLKVDMANQVLSIAGDLTAHDTEIGLNRDEMGPARPQDSSPQDSAAGQEDGVTLNLNIRAGRKVEFIWPNTGIPILQAYADMGSGIKVVSDSRAHRYSLEGDVRLRGGEIFYVERSFYIREGTLNFRENEIRFEPRISARAEVRDRSDTGPVTISMIVDNAPLESFTARFESNPSLSQVEILSLLGQSLSGLPAEDDGQNRGAFVASGFDILTQFVVVRRLERRIRDFLFLDMFSFRTNIIQNVLGGQGADTQAPVDLPGRIGNYFNNTTVFIGKYFAPDLFFEAMPTLRYDGTQSGSGGLNLGGGMMLEIDIGIELRSPLFDIRWNFTPLHQESLWVSDQSFTLTKRWSF